MDAFTPLNFTLQYDDRLLDVDDHSGDLGTSGATGSMRFTPKWPVGVRIPVTTGGTRAAGVVPRMFEGYVEGGRLKSEPGGDPGIRLWANDPAFGLEKLQYRVTAALTDPLGRPVPFRPFYFNAPNTDTEQYLMGAA